jgi:VWFA-related protein
VRNRPQRAQNEDMRTQSPGRPLGTGLALALATVLLPPLAAAPRQAEKPTFPAGTEVVTVDVVVTDRDGRPVTDLRKEDFTVTEDGKPQEIVAFDAIHRPAPAATEAPAPAAVAAPPAPELRSSSNQVPPSRQGSLILVVFDELHMTLAGAQRARKAVRGFLETGVARGDRVALVGTREGTRWTARMPEGRDALLHVLDRLQGRRVGEMVRDAMTDYEAMRIDQERDPIVTDQVMRRLVETGAIFHTALLPGETTDPGDVESWRSQTQSLASHVYAEASRRTEQALGIIERSLDALAGTRGRKSLVLVSGGIVQDSRLDVFHRVVSASRRANAAIYFIDVRGLVAATTGLQADVNEPMRLQDLSAGAGMDEIREASAGSEGLALDTGGFVIRNQNDLGKGLARVERDSRSYYLLGYTPTNRSADGRFRKISVKVARQGVTVRARRGYYAAGGSAKEPPETRDAAIQRALDAPFDLPDVPLRALAQVFGEKEKGHLQVLLTSEVDVRGLAFTEEGGTARDTVETLILVARRDTGEYSRFDQQFELSLRPETRARYERTWFPITREVDLRPGSYQAKIVARDRNSGRVGSVTADFEVPEASGLRVSSLTLSDRLREEAKGGIRTPELIARRSFAPSGVLHCRFEVYGAAKDARTGRFRVTAGFSIRRSDGRFLAALPETPLLPGPDGALARTVGTGLEGAPPGRYEAIVVVTDTVGGRAAVAREPFVIEPAP